MSSGPFHRVLEEIASERTLARGRSYHRQGRVGNVKLDDDGLLRAVVEGTSPYQVTLGLTPDGFRGTCTCYAWQREAVCKHVVALALRADEDEVSHRMLRLWLDGEAGPHDAVPVPAEDDVAAQYGPDHWRSRLARLESGARHRRADPSEGDSARAALFELWIDPVHCREQGGLVLALTRRPQLVNGSFGEAREASWASLEDYRSMPGLVRDALTRVEHLAARGAEGWGWRQKARLLIAAGDSAQALEAVLNILPVRCRLASGSWGGPLNWQPEPWRFSLVLSSGEDAGVPHARVEGVLRRNDEERPLEAARLLLSGGVAIFDREAAPFDDAAAFDWVSGLRAGGPLEVHGEDVAPFLEKLMEVSSGVPLDAGEMAEVAPPPEGILDLSLVPGGHAEASALFDYGVGEVAATQPAPHVVDREGGGRILQRNRKAESRLLEVLRDEEVLREGPDWAPRPYRLPIENLAQRCGRLIQAGWQIRVESMPLRSGGSLSVRVQSGIDWFDIQGEATFDQGALALPAILEAVREGRGFVALSDGGAALLPPEWQEQLEALGALTTSGGDEASLRITKSRAPLLDLLLADFADVQSDAEVKRLRRALRGFEGLAPRKEPAAFQGELRTYQREALGWFAFLRRVGLGGCLADDMGLGKTVQVLACLLSRKRAKDRRGPSLVVAPRSVMTNWVREAHRFAPTVRAATYHGPGRRPLLRDVSGLDLIVTTYGTMMRDIEALSDIEFDYVVLDESQAIKNAASKTARAARLLDGRHKLALSGTPIENHLDELGSLFAFLNPGLLGSRKEFQQLLGAGAKPSRERLAWLQNALKPVILRRTREQVLTELPEKEEQVLLCPLGPQQRKDYDAIREHFRASVLSHVDTRGLSGSKMHVLEALLRLRQTACHPGLVDPSRTGESSAKLEQLLPMLDEIADAGHKALVFSQFTSFLSIVRRRLDNEGIRYEYMDGKTRNRSEAIDRFQSDPDTVVFLISLKAGGVGLNLTAAQYVFLLDPWWNPAIEAQAIGRAHRMGQKNPVSVYRLIGEDTVEDRVLELQSRKRELVQAVLGGISDAPLRDITRDDLEALFG